MNNDQFFDDWYLIKNSAERADDHHYIEGLYPALERFEGILNLIIYSDCMTNEHVYGSCSERGNNSESDKSCLNNENQNLNFPTSHPSISSKELKEAIEFAKILSVEWIRSLKK